MQERNPFGNEGDFITSPMISSLFGKVIHSVIQKQLPHNNCLAEIGPGLGHLCLSILKESPFTTYLIEKNPHLEHQQKILFKTLTKSQTDAIHWVNQLPKNYEGALITHELFDAFPVHRVVVKNNTYHEIGVSVTDQGSLKEVYRPCDDNLLSICHRRGIPLLEGYKAEISTSIEPWISALSKQVRKSFWVLIDYGYERHQLYHPCRDKGTLRSYHKHQEVTNNWSWLGEQDITASVDFDLILETCVENGWTVNYFGPQHEFLAQNGIDLYVNQYAETDKFMDIANQCKQLMMEPLGNVMKVALLSKGTTERNDFT
ncbi:MAG TPA: SAM-dependent methyltransferase [Gammaproteobacteria bacterium]|nr:SAM-dependent methyltransferase [Gammaproteobacteria bacterium]